MAHIGAFCHDTLVSDKEVENHIDNRHYLNDSLCSFCHIANKRLLILLEYVDFNTDIKISKKSQELVKKIL